MSTIAQMVVELGLDASGFAAGLDAAKSKMANFGATMQKAGTMMSIGVTAPLLGVGAMALKSAGDFEQSMNIMQQVSGATAAEMATLEAQALQLGAETSFSAGEAALAMLELSKAGLSTTEVSGAIAGVLDLAAASGMGLAESAEIAANAMNAFGLEASATPEVANMLAAAANASSVDVSDLSAAMKMSSAVFASNKQPIDEMVVALSILGNNALKGSDAGTSLKTMLLSLANPTDAAQASLSDMGVAAYNADGSMRGFSDILGDLAIATRGMSDEQRNAALYTIFGADAIRAANILVKDYSGSWDDLQDAVNEGGAATAVANARMKGFAGAIEYLKGSIDSFLITTALPYLDMMGGVVRLAADAITAFGALPAPVRDAAVAFAVVLAAAGPLMLAIAGITTAVTFLLSPIGLVVLAVAGLAAVWAGDFMGIRTITLQVVAGVSKLWTAFADGRATMAELVDAIDEFPPGLRGVAAAAAAAVPDFIDAWNQISSSVQSFATSVATAFSNTKFPTLSELWEQFSAGDFTALGQTIASTAYDLLVNLDTELNLSAQADALRGKMVEVAAAVVSAVSTGLQAIDWAGALSAASSAWETLKAAAIAGIQSIDWAGALATAEVAWNVLKSAVVGSLGAIDWAGGLTAAGSSFEGLGSSVVGAIQSIDWAGGLTAAGDTLGGFVSSVVGKLTSIDWMAAFATAQAMVDTLRDNTLGAITGAITSIDWASAGTIITDAINGLADFIRTVDVTQVDWLGFITGKLLGPLGTALTTIVWVMDSEKFAGLKNAIIAAITSIDWAGIAGALTSLSTAIGAKLLEVANDIPTELAERINAIDWTQLSLDTAKLLTTWGENIAATDWSSLGQQVGASLVASIKGIFAGDAKDNPFDALKDAAVKALKSIQWGDLGTALAGFTGAVAKAIGDFLAGLFGELGIEQAIVDFPEPEWLDDLLAWKWPDIPTWLGTWAWPGKPTWLATLKWPDIPSWLRDWEWPTIEMPGWVQQFLDAIAWMNPFGGKKAEGGPVSARTTYLVGERGPELFTPGRSGRIIPNVELAGAWSEMAGAGAGRPQIVMQAVHIHNDMDVHTVAYQVAAEIDRWRR